MNYKDPQNNLHSLDSTEYEHLLPAGSVPITDEEAEALRPVPPAPTPLSQIRAIESTPEITDAMTRASRQLLLGTWFERVKAKPAAAGMSNDQIEAWCRANDKSYKALAEAEDAIKLLRALA